MFSSIIRILKSVPLTRDYSDTLVFASVSDQTTYFQSKSAYTFENLMYVNENIVQIPDQAGQYRNCNYIMWLNPDYPGKWFYGFIVSVQYINDGTTEVTFIEDFFQTWYFEMEVKQCFVAREHVNDDTVGKHLKEEPFALGDYVVNKSSIESFDEWWIIVVSSVTLGPLSSFPPATGTIVDSIYGGLEYRAYALTDIENIQNELNRLAEEGKSDAIVSMYMVPRKILPSTQATGTLISSNVVLNLILPPNDRTNLNGYVPKNNKMYTYPFRALKISNNAGQSVILRYEFFDETPTLAYSGTPFPSGRILVTPYKYNGETQNYDYTVTFSNYPQCAWLKDVYANWLATESVRYGYTNQRIRTNADRSLFKSSGQAISGLLTLDGKQIGNGIGNMLNSGLDLHYDLQDALRDLSEEIEVHSMIPPSVNGSIGNDATLVSVGGYSIVSEELTITYEYAKSADMGLSLYGYRVDDVKVPNIFGRKSWNYVKTVGAIVVGTAPSYAIENFRKLLNNGIRFWHGDYIGDFSRDNGIL